MCECVMLLCSCVVMYCGHEMCVGCVCVFRLEPTSFYVSIAGKKLLSPNCRYVCTDQRCADSRCTIEVLLI